MASSCSSSSPTFLSRSISIASSSVAKPKTCVVPDWFAGAYSNTSFGLGGASFIASSFISGLVSGAAFSSRPSSPSSFSIILSLLCQNCSASPGLRKGLGASRLLDSLSLSSTSAPSSHSPTPSSPAPPSVLVSSVGSADTPPSSAAASSSSQSGFASSALSFSSSSSVSFFAASIPWSAAMP